MDCFVALLLAMTGREYKQLLKRGALLYRASN
jgi:hypothetical protein